MYERQGGIAVLLVLITVVLLGVVSYEVYKDYQTHKLQGVNNLKSNQKTGLFPVDSSSIGESQKNPSDLINKFSYMNFSLNYPKNWVLLEMSKTSSFPLQTRLSPLYKNDKVIALKNGSIYLIITIEKEKDCSAGGIFINQQYYEKFVSERDKLSITQTTFYLNRDYSSISSLEGSEGGPYMWSAWSEFIPEKVTGSGTVSRGYENVVKRNGYMYNLIIVGNNRGTTSPLIQSEIVSILESINW
jgi:hypothetical protein